MAAESAVRIIFLGDSASAVRSVSRLETAFAGLGRTAKLVTGAVGIAMVGALAASTKAAIDFDRSMRNVNSIAKLSETQFQSLSKRVLALAGPTAQAPKTLADGLYDIVSSGFKANDAIKILAVSAKAATAGMTDTATASKAVVAVLNAYHLSADKAKNVSSLLFTEVNKGVNTFEELATNIGDTAPLAASLKIPFSDVAAGLALITLHGTSMAEAATQMSRVMADLLKPSDSLQATLKGMGYETGQAAISAHGFVPLIGQLSEAAKGSSATTADWFQNIRSLRGMLNLTGPNLRLFNRFAAEMAASFQKGGADVAAFNEQAKSISVQWARAKDALIAAAIPIGQLLFPALTHAAEGVTYLANTIGTQMPRIREVTGAVARAVGDAWDRYAIPALQEFGREVRQMARQVQANWPQIRATALSVSRSWASAMRSMGEALQALRPLVKALGPEFKVAFALAMLAVRTFAEQTAQGMHLVAVVIRTAAPFLTSLVHAFNAAERAIVGAVRGIASGASGAFHAVIGTINTLINAIKSLIGWISKIPSSIHLPSVPGGGGGGAGVGDVLKGIFGFAEGGFVPGHAGAPQIVLAHAGEVILNPMQQAALGGAAFFKQMFGFTGDEGPGFATGGIVNKRPKQAPHRPHHSRKHSPIRHATQAMKAVDRINQREDDLDRAYGQLTRQYQISDPDGMTVAEIDSLIAERNKMLDLLKEEKQALVKAIKELVAAIRDMQARIKRERAKKKPNTTLIGNLQSSIGEFQQAIGDEKLNLKHQLPFDIRDVNLDIAELRSQETAALAPPVVDVSGLLAEIARLELALSIQGAQTAIIGSFAKGTLSVPETGLALVHAGEQIVPAGQVRGGDGASIPPLNVNVHLSGPLEPLANFVTATVDTPQFADRVSVRIGQKANARARSGRYG